MENKIKDNKIKSRINDKTVISSHNVIPSGRQVNDEDVKNFVKEIKKNKKG